MPVTTLAAAITSGTATVCTVSDVADFPATGTYDVIIDAERITVGAGAGTVAWSSLTRGVQGTTAGTHSSGADVYLVPSAYATLTDLTDRLPGTVDDIDRTAAEIRYLSDLLVSASKHITTRSHRDFYRHPTSGTESRLYDGTGTDVLVVPEGIVSLTTVEIMPGTGQTFVTQGTADWFLDPAYPEPDDSYYVLTLADVLTDANSSLIFWSGKRTVRLTGAFGYATVPDIIRQGTLDLARQMWGLSPTGAGSMAGGSEFGTLPVPASLPLSTYRAIEWARGRTGIAIG